MADFNPLVYACERDNVDAVKLLLSHPATSERFYLPALCAAARYGYEICLDLLIERGVDVNGVYNSATALLVACETNQFETALKLLSHGAKLLVTEEPESNGRLVLQKIVRDTFSAIQRSILFDESKYISNNAIRFFEAIQRSGLVDLTACIAEGSIAYWCRHFFIHGYFELAKSIILSRLDSNTLQEFSFTLYYAAKNNWPEFVVLLLDKGIQIDSLPDPPVGRDLESPLIGACESGSADMVSILIDRGATLSSRGWCTDRTPLMVAASMGKTEIVRILLAAGANANEILYEINGGIGCDYENFSNHRKIRSKLISRSDWYTKGNVPCTALHAACARRRVDVVAILIEAKSYQNMPDKWGYTPVHVAAERGFDDIIELLLDNGHSVNTRAKFDETPLNLLCSSLRDRPVGTFDHNIFGSDESFVASVKLLLKHGANVNLPNVAGDTPLCNACASNRLDIVEIILDAGANADHFTKLGCPLWTACEKLNVDLVKLLLTRGANPNTKICGLSNHSFNRLDPLCIAVEASDIDIAKVLITSGALASNVDGLHKTALHYAVGATKRIYATELAQLELRLPIISLLLEHKADVNARDARGETPLAVAVLSLRSGHLRMYSNALEENYFITKRVRMDVATFRLFILPVVIAFVRTQVEVIRFLVNHGAILDDEHCSYDKSVITICDDSCRQSTFYPFLTCTPIGTILIDIFLKSHASLKWLFWVRDETKPSTTPETNNHSKTLSSVQLCKAILFAGYFPYRDSPSSSAAQAAEDKNRKKLSTDEETVDAWVKKDGEEISSLMRLCRLFIRGHLSEINERRSIVEELEKLPLPDELIDYLSFEGPLNEASIVLPDLSDESAMLDLLQLPSS